MVVYLHRGTEKKDAVDGVPDRPPSITIPPEVIAAMAVERAAGNYSRMYRVLRTYLEQTDPEGQKRQIVWLGIAEEINGDAGSQLSNLVRRFIALRSAEKGKLVSPQEFQKASNKMAEEIFLFIKEKKIVNFWFFQKDIANMARDSALKPHEWPGGLSYIMPNFSFINPLGFERVDLFSRQAIRDRLSDAGQHDASKEAEALGDSSSDQIGRWGSLVGTGLGALLPIQKHPSFDPDKLWGDLYLKRVSGSGFISPLLRMLMPSRGRMRWKKPGELIDGPHWNDLKQSLAVMPDLADMLGPEVGLWEFDRSGGGTEYRFVSDAHATILINGRSVTTLSREEAVRRQGRRISLGDSPLRYLVGLQGGLPLIELKKGAGNFMGDLARTFGRKDSPIPQEYLQGLRDEAGVPTVPGLDIVKLPQVRDRSHETSSTKLNTRTGKHELNQYIPFMESFDKLYPVSKEGIAQYGDQIVTTYTPEEARARRAALGHDRLTRTGTQVYSPANLPVAFKNLPGVPGGQAGGRAGAASSGLLALVGEDRPLLRGAPLPYPSVPAEPQVVVQVVRVEERFVSGDERSFDHRPWKMSLEDAIRQSALPALGYR